MRGLCVIFWLLVSLVNQQVQAANNQYIALCYHDIVAGLTDTLGEDQMAVGTDNLIAQFSWLKENGYHVISLQDIIDVREGRKSLPDKAVLITIDDGYASVYQYFYPLLKMYDYTAVVAVVGKWLSAKPGETVIYGDSEKKPRSFFLSWQQIREMQASGHIEIASHSYDLHHGELGNPQGNVQPAATTRVYDKQTHHYETDRAYYLRIKNDLKRNSDVIAKQTGIRPRAMVWPYGRSSRQTIEIAKELGMPITLGLREGRNSLKDISDIRRILLVSNPSLDNFVADLETIKFKDEPIRGMRVNLDDIYAEDPNVFTRNFDRLLDRIKGMKINTVFLSAFSDLDQDGYAESVYFPSRDFPTRADILNRVSWQIQTRAGGDSHVNVFIWMPVSGFKNGQQQLSEQNILRLYKEMAQHVYGEGLLLSQANGSGSDGFVNKLIDRVRYYRTGAVKAAVLLSGQAIQSAADRSEYWRRLAGSYNTFMVNLEPQPETVENYLDKVLAALPKGRDLKNIVFELQTIDSKTGARIPLEVLSTELDYLTVHKAVQLVLYPDDQKGDYPPLHWIKSQISVSDFPFGN